jgi:hypothetical protein
MTDKPEYVPVHVPPVWLSQADVERTIEEVVNKRGETSDKAVGWDILIAIKALAEQADDRS